MMEYKRELIAVLLLVQFVAGVELSEAIAEGKPSCFREDFVDLSAWEPLYFPKIEKHSKYQIHQDQAANPVLKVSSSASASALITKPSFNVFECSFLFWRWKISGVYSGISGDKKAGDDYVLRLYIAFPYDEDYLSWWERRKYNAYKLVRGEFPPHSTLNYVWANVVSQETIIESPYTDRAMMFAVDKGEQKIGSWQEYHADIVRDYKKAFGKEPPPKARIAVMGDSDNTGLKSEAFIDFIDLRASLEIADKEGS